MMNACLLCLRVKETVPHLLLQFSYTINLLLVLMLLGFLHKMDLFVMNGVMLLCCGKGKILWNLAFVVNIWAIRKERNRNCFDDKLLSLDARSRQSSIISSLSRQQP